MNKDPRLKILIISAAVILVGGIILFLFLSKTGEDKGFPQMEANSFQYDFGDVSMSKGKINYIFKIKNAGTGFLQISDIKTSCMCTSAYLKTGEEKSPLFGMHNNPVFWSKKLSSNETAELEVIFDPNAHGPEGVGPVMRAITMSTNDQGKEGQKKTFLISANVVK